MKKKLIYFTDINLSFIEEPELIYKNDDFFYVIFRDKMLLRYDSKKGRN